MCWLLTKWYFEQGIKEPKDIRGKLFDWACKNKLYLAINVNDCIKSALSNPRRLTSDNPIRVSKSDIKEITDRFDRKNTRLCALGLLCYAKQFADQNNEFELPYTAFGNWVGIAYNNIYTRYMPELEYFGYVKKYGKVNKATNRSKGEVRSKSPRFTILVPIVNEGEYVVENNNIIELYEKIFTLL